MKRRLAVLILLFSVSSCVAPIVGAEDNTLTISTMAQDITNVESNKEKIFSSIYKKYQLERLKEISEINYENKVEEEPEYFEIIPEELITYTDFEVPPNKVFKSYMGSQHITSKTSSQYELKNKYVLDYETGIYTVDGRYCCALGSYYTTDIGIYFDIIMTSGEIIPCILADCKADKHTDELNQYTLSNSSIVEFVVNEKVLIPKISNRWGNTGDISYLGGIFDGEIDYIRIYE